MKFDSQVRSILNFENIQTHFALLTLQEAFLARKQGFISGCKERQKRLVLANENRRMQECLRLEREAIFAEQGRLQEPNLHAHPYSGRSLSTST